MPGTSTLSESQTQKNHSKATFPFFFPLSRRKPHHSTIDLKKRKKALKELHNAFKGYEIGKDTNPRLNHDVISKFLSLRQRLLQGEKDSVEKKFDSFCKNSSTPIPHPAHFPVLPSPDYSSKEFCQGLNRNFEPCKKKNEETRKCESCKLLFHFENQDKNVPLPDQCFSYCKIHDGWLCNSCFYAWTVSQKPKTDRFSLNYPLGKMPTNWTHVFACEDCEFEVMKNCDGSFICCKCLRELLSSNIERTNPCRYHIEHPRENKEKEKEEGMESDALSSPTPQYSPQSPQYSLPDCDYVHSDSPQCTPIHVGGPPHISSIVNPPSPQYVPTSPEYVPTSPKYNPYH